MLTIRDYNKENLDRSSITIVDRYLSIIGDKENEIDNIKNATLSIYPLIYWYINDARNKLKELNDLVDEWEDKTGIDTTSIRDEIKHTEAMTDAVEEITDVGYGDDETEEEIEEKVTATEENTEDVVTVVKENPEIKEEVKTEVKADVTPSTPAAPSTPTPTPEEAKETARQEAADSIRSRGDDGRGITYTREESTNPVEQAARDAINTVINVITEIKTGESVPTVVTTSTTREQGLDAAATVIERGGTAEEATKAYTDAVNPNGITDEGGVYVTYGEGDRETINDDIQAIIDAANEAASSSESSSSSSESGENPGGEGDSGCTTDTGDCGCTADDGDCGCSVDTGDCGCPGGDTGDCGCTTDTGDCGCTVDTGDCGCPSDTGDCGCPSDTGDCGCPSDGSCSGDSSCGGDEGNCGCCDEFGCSPDE